MTHLDEKIRNCYIKAMTGVALAVKNDYDNAVHSFRYVGEAMMKALIYKHYGECDGHLIIKGRMNTGRQPTGTVRNLSYSPPAESIKCCACTSSSWKWRKAARLLPLPLR